MKTVSKVIFWIFVIITIISLLASLLLCSEENESKNARTTAFWSMISGIVLTYISWLLWSL